MNVLPGVRSGNCTLQSLANELNISEMPYDSILEKNKWDKTFPLIRENNKCIKCMRCVQICDNVQGMHVWDVVNTGSRTTVNVAKNRLIQETNCTLCGQCVVNCPVGALRERDDVGRVLDAVEDENIITVVQIAPAVRTAWGEGFGLSKDFATAKRLVAGLRGLALITYLIQHFQQILRSWKKERNLSRDLQMEILICIQCLHPVVQDGYVSSNLSIHRW